MRAAGTKKRKRKKKSLIMNFEWLTMAWLVACHFLKINGQGSVQKRKQKVQTRTLHLARGAHDGHEAHAVVGGQQEKKKKKKRRKKKKKRKKENKKVSTSKKTLKATAIYPPPASI
jgi:uncharacterized metal-binding protein